MKNDTIEKNISMVKILRDIREKMSLEIADMSAAELKAYFKKRREFYTGKTERKEEVVLNSGRQ